MQRCRGCCAEGANACCFWYSILFFLSFGLDFNALSNFKLDASSDSLVLENDDDLRYYREVNSDYASSDFLIVETTSSIESSALTSKFRITCFISCGLAMTRTSGPSKIVTVF